MKRSTTGLERPILKHHDIDRHGCSGKSTGNSLRELKYAPDREIDVMNQPSARKRVITAMESVIMLAFGMDIPRA